MAEQEQIRVQHFRKEHLETLRKGPQKWNEWRKKHRSIQPELSGAELSLANLSGADLSYAYLSRAQIDRANLSGADLSHAYLRRADLSSAKLMSANLSGAKLTADLSHADLSGADLRAANHNGTNLSGAILSGADLTEAGLVQTVLAEIDLSQVKGLKSVFHSRPSPIGIDTIYRSKGMIPEVFLRGAGVPEPFTSQVKALVGALEPIQFYSCFISYSSKDHDFAKRLHADLQQRGVRCWIAAEDMKIGDRIRPTIDEAIRVYDKLLLVLTESSIKSPWVESEVEAAFEKERKQGKRVLFPIQLDGAVTDAGEAWAAEIRRTRHIGDFRGWNSHDKYKVAFERLMRDLKA